MTPLPIQARTVIERAIREAAGESFSLRDCEPVTGGCIHRALRVADGATRYFVKLGPAETQAMFEAEADGLAAIRASDTMRTPATVAIAAHDGYACLVLEHLDMEAVRTPEHGERFADALARMHATQGERFGWHRDNFIGSTPQSNTPYDNWALFFVRERLRPQFQRARALGFTGELQRAGERLMDRVPALFLDYRPKPALLHGDLWHGNVHMTAEGPALIDPSCSYGHREVDLAMAALFGGFPAAFQQGYADEWPLRPGAGERRPIYQLYYLLVHVNLFGGSYVAGTERALDAALGG